MLKIGRYTCPKVGKGNKVIRPFLFQRNLWIVILCWLPLIMVGCCAKGVGGESKPEDSQHISSSLANPVNGLNFPLTLKTVDVAVANSISTNQSSKTLSEDITIVLNIQDAHVNLYDKRSAAFIAGTRQKLGKIVDQAIRDSKRYEGNKELSSSVSEWFLEKSNIAVVQYLYPSIEASATLKKDKLTITVWVCPDKSSAVELFDIRSGKIKVPTKKEDVSSTKESRAVGFAMLPADKGLGDLAYSYQPGIIYNAPLPETDSRSGGDRIGFIRNNVVVEASTWDYFRPTAEAKWLTTGLAVSAKEVMAILMEIDSCIRYQTKD